MYIPVTTHSKLQPGLSLFFIIYLIFSFFISLSLSFLSTYETIPPFFLKKISIYV